MGITFNASSKSADAPDIEEGTYPADFESIAEDHIDKSQFGSGDIWVWRFTAYDQGDPVKVEATSSRNLNIKSKTTPTAVRYLKGLCTKQEFQAFLNGDGFDAEKLVGRRCQVEIEIKDSGWPKVVNVMPAAK